MKSIRPSLPATLFLALAGLLLSFQSLSALDVVTEGAEVGKWTMDYDAATKLAEEKSLPMLLNFTGSDWCGWCKRMDAAVFAQEEWESYAAEEIVLITLDFPNDSSIVPAKYVERNKKLQTEFGVRGYPTYIILDSDAKTVLGQLGAGADKTPDSFIQELENVLRFRPASIEKKVAELGEEKGAEYRKALKGVEAVQQELKDWLETRPQRNPENDKKFAGFQEAISEAVGKLDDF